MAKRRDYVVSETGTDTQMPYVRVTMRRDLATETELANAPGAASVTDMNSEKDNQSIRTFYVWLDPLYPTPEEALADLKEWLNERTVNLDSSVWDQ